FRTCAFRRNFGAMLENKNSLPLYFAAVLILGLVLGYRMSSGGSSAKFVKSKSKFNQLISSLERNYVDQINLDSIVELSMYEVMSNLDPHSVYIDSEDMKAVKEDMQGEFDGIGVEYTILDDSIMIIHVLENGPADQAGMEDGDRILRVDSQQVSGVELKDADKTKGIKGEKGSLVTIEVLRAGKSISFDISRGSIPNNSVDLAYMINDSVGYLKLNRFSGKTEKELSKAFQKLNKQHPTSILVDLRDNPGGYLSAAIDLLDYFMEKGTLLVTSKGKNRPDKRFESDGNGMFRKTKLALLINENSASASEVVAGAVQDNDRGLLVGQRTFGKGLIQEEYQFADGSTSRITTSRYYTPSGRSIQRPYTFGQQSYDYYTQDLDSLHASDSITFFTTSGRKVFGGGGILPDVLVEDTLPELSYRMSELLFYAAQTFSFRYVDARRDEFKQISVDEFLNQFNFKSVLEELIVAEAKANDLKKIKFDFDDQELVDYFELRLKQFIVQKGWSRKAALQLQNQSDLVIQTTLKQLENETY
ncbi:MAG: S41 family peptidase, partial [Flavobacteriales bacterium]